MDMNGRYAIILDPREEGKQQVNMDLRGKLCYLDSSSGTPEFLYVDQRGRWSQEEDPAWERANSDYPNPRTPEDVIEDIRYELGLCKLNPINGRDSVRFIDISILEEDLAQAEHDLSVRLSRRAMVSDIGVLWSYQQRVKNPTPEKVEPAA